MKSILQKTVILAVAIAASTLTPGCEEQNLSNAKKCRLIANENGQLKKQIAEQELLFESQTKKERELYEKNLQNQRALLEKELHEQKNRLKQCLDQKKFLEGRGHARVREQVDSVLKGIMEETKKLHLENEELKAQVAQLKEELEELKN